MPVTIAQPTAGVFQIQGAFVPVTISGGVVQALGNATVPDDAPIQPAQAFVDNITKLTTTTSGGIDLSNQGITKLTGSFFGTWALMYGNGVDVPNMNFSGNAIDVGSVNAVLAVMVANIGSLPPTTLNLSGGTNAAPTGQGLIDKAALILAGWTVTTN